MKEITAMPMVMIDDYIPKQCESLESRAAFVLHHNRTSRVIKSPEVLAPGVELRIDRDSENRLWFYACAGTVLHYLMHLNPLRFTGSIQHGAYLNMYQGSVWRGEDSIGAIRKLPPKMFWSLFREGRNWFSDSIQSKAGKIFWENRILEALEVGHTVTAVHFLESGGAVHVDQVIPIELNQTISKYWTNERDKDDEGMNWRFAITHK